MANALAARKLKPATSAVEPAVTEKPKVVEKKAEWQQKQLKKRPDTNNNVAVPETGRVLDSSTPTKLKMSPSSSIDEPLTTDKEKPETPKGEGNLCAFINNHFFERRRY